MRHPHYRGTLPAGVDPAAFPLQEHTTSVRLKHFHTKAGASDTVIKNQFATWMSPARMEDVKSIYQCPPKPSTSNSQPVHPKPQSHPGVSLLNSS